jgi:uncharacterized OB-fold protein
MSEADVPRRQLPGLDQDNTPYWTGGARGELLIHHCSNCGYYLHPPLPNCSRCDTPDPVPVPASGRGKVKSYTINHQSWVPGMATPFIIAAVELQEQPELYVLSNIVGCAPEAVYSGMPVKVQFEQHGEIFVPLFAPETAA